MSRSTEESPKRRYTYDELVAEVPETNRPCELWDGEIVRWASPCVYHQQVVMRFCCQLHDWVESRKLGGVVPGPVDMVLSPHRVTQPDVLFISRERMGIATKAINGPGDLAAEITSLRYRCWH